MKRASFADVDSRLGEYLEHATVEPIIITRDGRPVAALVAVDDEEEIDRLLSARRPSLRRYLEGAYARIKRGEGMSEEEFWAAVEADAVRNTIPSARRSE